MKQFLIETTDDTLLIKRSLVYNIYSTLVWAFRIGLVVLLGYSYFSSVVFVVVSIAVFALFVLPNTYITEPVLCINRATRKLRYYHDKKTLDLVLFNKAKLIVDEDHEEEFCIILIATTNKEEDNHLIFGCRLGYFSEDQSVEIAKAIANFLQFELTTNVTEED